MKSLKNEDKKSLISKVNEEGLRSVVDKLLRQDKRLWTTDGKLIENKLIEFVQKDDENIIKLLLGDSLVKDTFFQKVSSVLVFKKDDFITFMTMGEFLDGSYTKYSKHIGLVNNFSSIKNAGEVVLDFPYKDCVLEGGQEKGSEGRDEVFYNKILAKEEINRLEEEKVFTNWAKYTGKGKEKVISFDHKKDNLILRGNNLLALYSLLPKYRGKIKLIYIDPPYNTGTDDFKYNDRFNHSSWLVFMKNRLEVAKKLLKDDGVIFVQCDDNEQAYLKVLMDEIFGIDSMLNCLVVEMSPSGGVKTAHKEKRFIKNKEYVLVYKNNLPVVINPIYDELDSYDGNYTIFFSGKEFTSLNKKLAEINKDYEKIDLNKILFFDDIKKFILLNKENIYRRHGPSKWALENISKGKLIYKKGDGTTARSRIYQVFNPKEEKEFEFLMNINQGEKESFERLEPLSWKMENNSISVLRGDLWLNYDKDMGNVNREGGVKLSGGKKPERLISDILKSTTKTGDLILDYHIGTGTTCAVAHKMNRQYIGIEQINYGENDSVVRLNNVVKGDETGISETFNWKGGGSFVYAELAEWNKKYIQEVEETKTTKDLIKIYEKMSKETFFVYTFDQSKWDNKKFEELSLENQKKILIELLNMNHLYVNYKDIEDTTFKVSKEDIEINKKFYE